MTQLARPDPARKRSSGRDVHPGPYRSGPDRARAFPVLPPGESVHRQATVSRPVPGWVPVSAFLSPVLLVGGWLVAGAIQPASYSPMRQTISVLAGATGTDRWVMTSALLLVGCSQIATGAGLSGARVPARILLVLTGVSTLGVAATPEPATGPTPQHLFFVVSCVVTTAVWPVVVARRVSTQPWSLSIHGGIAMTAGFAALCGWLLITTHGGTDLGLAERLTSSAQGMWPLVVVLALRRSASQNETAVSAAVDRAPTGQDHKCTGYVGKQLDPTFRGALSRAKVVAEGWLHEHRSSSTCHH
jgi:hypothetical membrane protein